jgi:hypothetical protein
MIMKMLFKCRRLLREFYNSDSHLYDLETKVLPRLLTSLSRKKDFNEQSGDDAMMTKKNSVSVFRETCRQSIGDSL